MSIDAPKPPDASIDAPVLTAAVLNVAPLTNPFGSVTVGSTSTASSFTVTNSGQQTSGSISASITGSGASNFNIETNGCTTLAGGATCTISVSFTPATAGQKTGSLAISASPGGSIMASLDGVGTAAGLSIASASNSFGNVVVGATSTTTATFTITNSGSATTGTLATAVSGSDPGEFTKVTDTCSAQTLAPLATCTITAQFTPSSAGAKSASFDITGNPGGAVSGIVTGTGLTDAHIVVNPSPNDFGSVIQGQTSASVTFTATNTGGVATGALAPAAITGTDAANFTVVSSTCDGTTLAPAATCGVIVRFAPASTGNKAAQLTIIGAPGGTGSATLLGNGISVGQLTISPANNFGNVTVGQISTSQTLTVTNTGGSASGTLGTALAGNDPSQFTIVAGSNGCQGIALASGGQCTIAVEFTPTTGGTKSANLTVTGNPGGTATAGLGGNAIPGAQLSISPLTKDFGSIGTNTTTAAQSFTITNIGGQDTGIPAVSLGGANATQFQLVNGCTTALIPGATCTAQVKFAPTINGNDTATLDVTASPGGAVSATLFGQGVIPAQIQSNGTPAFPLTLIGDTSAAQFIVVTNNGTETTGTITVTKGGANPGDFTETNNCTTLAMGASCTITITFSPTVTGARSASVSINASPGGSLVVPFTGTAKPRLELISPATNPFVFNPAIVNTNSAQTVSITVVNNTTAIQPITTASVLGGQFNIIGNNCTNLAAASSPGVPNGSCTVTLNFIPTTTGVKNGSVTLSIPGGGPNNQAVQQVTGTGTNGLSITAVTTNDFGPIAVQTASAGLVFTVLNDATAQTTGNIETVLTGNQFAVTADSCHAAVLVAGATCSIHVIFLPTVTGAASSTLSVTGNPGGSASINVKGTGVAQASLTLNPAATLAFGNVFSGETSPKTITVSNPAGSATTGVVTITPPAAPYSVAFQAGDCQNGVTTLAAGTSCIIHVVFSPTGTAFGLKNGSIQVAANPGGGTKTVALTGTSVSTISASAGFNFGNRALGTTTNHGFVITNNSNNTITVMTSTLNPSNPDVTIISNTCSTLAPGANCTVTVRFAPSVNGDIATETLSTTTSTSTGIATATVDGHGLSIQDVDWTEVFSGGAPFDFGTTLNGEVGVIRAFSLKNNGETTSAVITGITFSDAANFTVTADTCTTHTLAPNATCTVTVQFTPVNAVATVDRTSTLTAAGVTGLTNTTINVFGRSIASGAVILTPTIASYPNTVVGQNSALQTFTLQNTGLSTAQFFIGIFTTNNSINPTFSPDFTPITSTCGAVQGAINNGNGSTGQGVFDDIQFLIPGQIGLAAGASCNVTVQFNPSVVGANRAFLSVLNNSQFSSEATMPYAPLTGTGLQPAGITINPSPLPNFGLAAVGTITTQTLTLTNNGQVASGAISTSALSGADVSQFAVPAGTNTCVGALAANASCTIVVQFKPTTVGAKSAQFSLAATPGLTSTVQNLNGTGVTQATLGVSPSTQQSAGSHAVGSNDGTTGTDFTVTNGGDVASGNLSITLSNNTDYLIGAATTCVAGAPMPPNSTCHVFVQFSPRTLGNNLVTTLTVSGVPGGTDTGSITGNGTSALTVTTPVNLGIVTAITGIGVSTAVTWTNNADVSTGILEPVVLAGANAGEVSIVDDSCGGAILAAHATCTIHVVLVPSTTGAKTATLTVQGNPGNSATATLTGTGN